MERSGVEHVSELSVNNESKRQKISRALEKYKSDTSQLLTGLHDHLDMVVERRFREVELKEKELQVLTLKLVETKKQIKEAETEVADKVTELDLLRNMVKLEEERLVEVRESVKSTESELELKKKQLQVLTSQMVDTKKEIDEKGRELKAIETEVGDRGKELGLLRDQVKVEEERLVEVRESVKSTESELELKKKELSQKSIVLVKQEKQVIEEETENSSVSLSCGEVSRALRAKRNPAEYVLDLVERNIKEARQREDSRLKDTFVENLVLFLEELEVICGSDMSQFQLRATQVATLWKEMIRIEAPESAREALAFLLFIVVYGLKSLINKEETVLLATSAVHYEEGPRIFHSFGLKLHIPEFVVDLMSNRQYIPAVRLICLLKLTEYSPSNILMKEVNDLRRTTRERVESKDVGRLRAILELVADYKLDIDIPIDLITKLMLQRENSTPPVLYCSVTHRTTLNTTCASSSTSATARWNVDLRVPKHEVKPFVNSSANCRY